MGTWDSKGQLVRKPTPLPLGPIWGSLKAPIFQWCPKDAYSIRRTMIIGTGMVILVVPVWLQVKNHFLSAGTIHSLRLDLILFYYSHWVAFTLWSPLPVAGLEELKPPGNSSSEPLLGLLCPILVGLEVFKLNSWHSPSLDLSNRSSTQPFKIFQIFFFLIFIYFTALGLNCGMLDL